MLHRALRRRSTAIVCSGIFLLVSLSGIAFAQSSAVRKLLNSNERPTVADVIAVAGTTQSNGNPFASIVKSEHALLSLFPHDFDDNLAFKIAQLEMLYPGATLAPLGRDVVWLGDAFDAFYTSIGQPGRVSRLNASTPTLKNISPAVLVEFLRSAGFTPEDMQNSAPFIMFDRSEFRDSGGARQLARLFDAAFTKLIELHGPKSAELIAEKFNAFAINARPNRSLADASSKVLALALKNLQVSQLKKGQVPTHVAFVDNTLSSVLVDNGQDWHDTFGPFVTTAGKLQGSIPNPGSGYNDYRANTLYLLHEIIKRVSLPSFLALVQSYAQSLDYTFSTKRVYKNQFEPTPLDMDVASKEYQALIDTLPNQPDEMPNSGYFSPNAQLMVSWLDRSLNSARIAANQEHLLMLFTEGYVEALNSSKLTRRDKRYVLARILTVLADETGNQPSTDFIDWFKEFFDQEDELQSVWNTRAEYFLDEDPDRRGGPSVPLMYKLLSEKLGQCAKTNSCSVPVETIPVFCRHLFEDRNLLNE